VQSANGSEDPSTSQSNKTIACETGQKRESENDIEEAEAKRARLDSTSTATTNTAGTNSSFPAEQGEDEAEELADGDTGQTIYFDKVLSKTALDDIVDDILGDESVGTDDEDMNDCE
jgi:hypothetical protein